jgi:hypothetical protein
MRHLLENGLDFLDRPMGPAPIAPAKSWLVNIMAAFPES